MGTLFGTKLPVLVEIWAFEGITMAMFQKGIEAQPYWNPSKYEGVTVARSYSELEIGFQKSGFAPPWVQLKTKENADF